MEADIKEVVGLLMRVLGGGETTRAEIENLNFEATGALQVAVNEAFIKLLEFAHDCEAGLKIEAKMRSELQQSLDEIVRLTDQS